MRCALPRVYINVVLPSHAQAISVHRTRWVARSSSGTFTAVARSSISSLIQFIVTGDKLIFVGDLITPSRLPRSPGHRRRTGAVTFAATAEKLLSWHAGPDEQAPEPPKAAEGARAHARGHRRRAPRGRLDAAPHVPAVLRSPEHGACVVHAGVLPGKVVEEQDWSTLMHIRAVRRSRRSHGRQGRARLWGEELDGARDRDRHIVFGHNAVPTTAPVGHRPRHGVRLRRSARARWY